MEQRSKAECLLLLSTLTGDGTGHNLFHLKNASYQHAYVFSGVTNIFPKSPDAEIEKTANAMGERVARCFMAKSLLYHIEINYIRSWVKTYIFLARRCPEVDGKSKQVSEQCNGYGSQNFTGIKAEWSCVGRHYVWTDCI